MLTVRGLGGLFLVQAAVWMGHHQEGSQLSAQGRPGPSHILWVWDGHVETAPKVLLWHFLLWTYRRPAS